MGIFMSFSDLNLTEYPSGYLSIPTILAYQNTSLIHLNWYATKADAEAGAPYIQQTAYEVSNTLFTGPDFYAPSYQYILTLPEFSSGVLDAPVPAPEPEP